MDRTQYRSQVAGAGDDIILALDVDGDVDLEEQLRSQFHKLENEHYLVIDEDFAIEVLRVSDHPTAQFHRHGTAMESGDLDCGRAAFPFGACAAAALAEDVMDYLRREHGLDGPLTRELVLNARATLGD